MPGLGGGGGLLRPQQSGWYKRRLPLITPVPGGGGGTSSVGLGGGPAALLVGSGSAGSLARTRRAIVALNRVPGLAAGVAAPSVKPPWVVCSDRERPGLVFRTPLIAAKINVAGGVIKPWVWRRDYRRDGLVYLDKPFLKNPPPPVAGSVPAPLVVRFDRRRPALVFFEYPPLEAAPIIREGTTWISFYSEARDLVWYSWLRAFLWEPGMATFLTKRSGENRQYTMDFSELPELSSGRLSGVSSVVGNVLTVGATNLTLTSPAVGSNGKTASVWISGGQPGASYQIAFTVTMAGGTVLEEFGYLLVEDE